MSNILKQNYLPALLISVAYGLLVLTSDYLQDVYFSIIPVLFLILIPSLFFIKMSDNNLFSFSILSVSFYLFLYTFILSVVYMFIYSVYFNVGDYNVVDVFSGVNVVETFKKFTLTTILIFSIFMLFTVYMISVLLNAMYYKVVVSFSFKDSLIKSISFSFYNFRKFFMVVFVILFAASLVEVLLVNVLTNPYIAVFLINSIQVFLLSLMFIYVSHINKNLILKKSI